MYWHVPPVPHSRPPGFCGQRRRERPSLSGLSTVCIPLVCGPGKHHGRGTIRDTQQRVKQK